MQIRDGDYQERDQDTFGEITALELLQRNPDASLNDDTIINGLNEAFATTLADTVEPSFSELYDAAYIVDASGRQLTKRAEELGFIRQDAVKATGVVEFSRNQAATTDYTIPQGTVVETLAESPVQFETAEDVTLTQGSTSVNATVRAIEGGTSGNVGANTIEAMPSPPTGIGSVTNPNPTGDPSYTDTNGNTLLIGQDREDDEELRNRVLRQDGSPGSASSDDITTAISNINSVIDAVAIVNDTGSTTDGLDPYSTEVVVQGGTVSEIIATLFETTTPIGFRRLQAGNFGTGKTDTVYDPFTESDVTGRFSRPTIRDPSTIVDIVVTDDFVGSNRVVDAIIQYTGGVDTDGDEYVGLPLGEDPYVEELRNAITDVEGVRGVTDIILDTNGDGNDDTTTDANGLRTLDIAKNEVLYLQTNDVTINTTQA
jgi:hypothetical protein